MIHLMKETSHGVVTTKCGRTGKSPTLVTTGWESTVTCPDCLARRTASAP